MIPARVLVHEFAVVFSRTIHFICSFTRLSHVAAYSSNWNVLSIERLGARCTSNIPCSYPRWEAVSPVSSCSIPMFRADFLHDASKSVQMEPNLPHTGERLVKGFYSRKAQGLIPLQLFTQFQLQSQASVCRKMQEDQTCLSSSHEWQQALSVARQRQILLVATQASRQDVSLACTPRVW